MGANDNEAPQDTPAVAGQPHPTSGIEIIDFDTFLSVWGLVCAGLSAVTRLESLKADVDSADTSEYKAMEVVYRRISENPKLHFLLDKRLQFMGDVAIVGMWVWVKGKAVRGELKERKAESEKSQSGMAKAEQPQEQTDKAESNPLFDGVAF